MSYKNFASSESKALVIFLIDVSASMASKMPDGRLRHVVVQDALQAAISQLTEFAFQSGEVLPRYRLLVLAYSEEIWDVFDGIKTIDAEEFHIPELPPQKKTNPAMALEYVHSVLEADLKNWSDDDLRFCPPPMVVHLTDAEISEQFEDPEPYAEAIKKINVPDGNVLMNNIYISPYLKVKTMDFNEWRGFFDEDSTGDPFGDKLLKMSSILPDTYQDALKEKLELNLQPSTRMFYPGTNLQFIRGGLVVSGSSSFVAQKRNTDNSEDGNLGLEREGDIFPE